MAADLLFVLGELLFLLVTVAVLLTFLVLVCLLADDWRRRRSRSDVLRRAEALTRASERGIECRGGGWGRR
jgi:hypothetical protein